MVTLSFNYAASESANLSSSQAQILWNSILVALVSPSDYNVGSFSIDIPLLTNKNTLTFLGVGTADNWGLTIDNVALVRKGTASPNFITNGDFENPNVGSNYRRANNFPGWAGSFM
jgi:hypothetical protein